MRLAEIENQIDAGSAINLSRRRAAMREAPILRRGQAQGVYVLCACVRVRSLGCRGVGRPRGRPQRGSKRRACRKVWGLQDRQDVPEASGSQVVFSLARLRYVLRCTPRYHPRAIYARAHVESAWGAAVTEL